MKRCLAFLIGFAAMMLASPLARSAESKPFDEASKTLSNIEIQTLIQNAPNLITILDGEWNMEVNCSPYTVSSNNFEFLSGVITGNLEEFLFRGSVDVDGIIEGNATGEELFNFQGNISNWKKGEARGTLAETGGHCSGTWILTKREAPNLEVIRLAAAEAERKRKQEQARLAVAEAERKRKQEEAQLAAAEAKLKRKLEAARLVVAEAERKRKQGEARLAAEAERKRKQEEARLAAAETERKRKQEEARLAAAETERKRKQEEARLAAAEAKRKRKQEETRLAAEAEQKRKLEAARLAAAEAEARRLAELERIRKIEENRRLAELRRKRIEDETRRLAEAERKASEARLAAAEAERKRKEEEARLAKAKRKIEEARLAALETERKRKAEAQQKMFATFEKRAITNLEDVQMFIKEKPTSPDLLAISTTAVELKKSLDTNDGEALKAQIEVFEKRVAELADFTKFRKLLIAKREQEAKELAAKKAREEARAVARIKYKLATYRRELVTMLSDSISTDSNVSEALIPIIKLIEVGKTKSVKSELSKLLASVEEKIIINKKISSIIGKTLKEKADVESLESAQNGSIKRETKPKKVANQKPTNAEDRIVYREYTSCEKHRLFKDPELRKGTLSMVAKIAKKKNFRFSFAINDNLYCAYKGSPNRGNLSFTPTPRNPKFTPRYINIQFGTIGLGSRCVLILAADTSIKGQGALNVLYNYKTATYTDNPGVNGWKNVCPEK